jgi:hypothetical protein
MKNIASSLVIAATALLGVTAAQAAVVFSFTPSAQHINVGDSVSVGVSISGLDTEILSAFDINFIWNSSILSSLGADFSPACDALGAGAICANDVNSPGNLGLQYISALDDDDLAAIQPDDSFLLGVLTLTGLADGASQLALGLDVDFERNLVGRDAATLDVQFGSTCIAVGSGSCATVPEPASYGLVLLAMAGAILPGTFRRRRMQLSV